MSVFLILESDQFIRQRLIDRYRQHGTVLAFDSPMSALTAIQDIKFDFVAVAQHRVADPEYAEFFARIRLLFNPTEMPLLVMEALQLRTERGAPS